MPKNFGSLKKDGNNQTIQAGISFQTYDASTSPKTSPLSYSNTVITLAIPTNAVEVVFSPSTALRVGEAVAMTQYYTQAANTVEAYGVADMSNIYIVRDSADGTLNFRFIIV